MNQTSRVLLALLGFLSFGCRKVAIDVGDSPDGGPDSASTGGTGGGGLGGSGGQDTSNTWTKGGFGGQDTSNTWTGGGLGGFGGPMTSSSSSGWTRFTVLESPERAVDILFVIDNSPSMDPKQKALANNFPKMIEALQKVQGGMPDVHIGVISSDMGAGNGEAGGNCSSVLGNQGILWGNDPNFDPSLQNNKYASVKGLRDSAGDDGCGMNSGTRWIEDIQNADGVGRSKNYKGELTDVFSCLAKAVGVGGCGYEHTLQSLRVALNPMNNINMQNDGFLRQKASLAIVILSDEDDCSADPDNKTNDGMFSPRTLGDTASLRCAARGHVCNGKAIPNFDPAKGYTGTSPFTANLADCDAKDDDPSNRNYHELPLIRIQEMIDTVRQVKYRPTEQIMVAGIIGWPENANLNGAQYRIDKDSTSMPVEQQKLWDYMPICTVPDQRSNDGNIYKAYAGFRLKKFIDGFGSNGQIYSICSTDTFANAMQQIGNALAIRMRPGCVSNPLVDSNPNLPETQPECKVFQQIPCETPGQADCLMIGYTESPLSECTDPTTGNPLSPSNPALDRVPDAGRPCWYLAYDTDRITGCADAALGQKIAVLRKGNGNAPAGSILSMSCRICDSVSDLRCASH